MRQVIEFDILLVAHAKTNWNRGPFCRSRCRPNALTVALSWVIIFGLWAGELPSFATDNPQATVPQTDTAPLLGTELPYEPTENYHERIIRGWRVLVHRSLLEEHRELSDRVLELLDIQLYAIVRTVPERAVDKLREVPIWVEHSSTRVTCACYHPSRGWLKAHGMNPDKAGAVEIGNAETFLAWTLSQPSMVLHELAHAYHHRFLGGYDNPEIKAAWHQAVESGKYLRVLHWGGSRRRAYAIENPQEYFAELSEAWFGVNDFYPFVRAEVIQHDPEGAKLLRKLWGG